ncbi:hypothetical protein CONCODRAFT_116659 [Conidiobolus coronatus NRRL 28638]|uniref:Uncharacterized protein n=1 Tax=Conidiobolus coronatus (strain ATCC 28846 / CBS 209.66 / NRRL 28638) TaxID=796925 RepID=A0A137PEE4_CONC2|nr:hypothetical protein CONCODRAFT_116659 [Conidiobolus coronatus NRRL 28638]|eukprot:KXN73311.1 hypothetical protein CONCODRAFT_116659 [Conidiobolus coronatus NRRL 28638]
MDELFEGLDSNDGILSKYEPSDIKQYGLPIYIPDHNTQPPQNQNFERITDEAELKFLYDLCQTPKKTKKGHYLKIAQI